MYKRQIQARALTGGSTDFLAKQIVDLLGVGLALAGLHDLADQRIESLVLAGPELRDVVGIGSNDLVDDPFECCLLYTSRCV